MSVPGWSLYGGVMQKRWSVNSMMLAFVAFALVLLMWVLYGFRWLWAPDAHLRAQGPQLPRQLPREARPVLNHQSEQGQGNIPNLGSAGVLDFPQSTLVYFQSSSRRSRRS